MRMILGIVAGVVVSSLCVLLVETVGHSLFPPPPSLDVTTPEGRERLFASMPPAAFAFVVSGWFLGTLVGGWVANAIARRALAGWVVALLIILGGLWTMATIPHPYWMWVVGPALPLLSAWLAQRLAKVRV